MADLYEIIYTSRRADGITDTDIVNGIILPSSRKNRRLDITGCLWFDDESFLQVLEGPRHAVEDLYQVIRGDPRHDMVETLSASHLSARSFTRWAMRSLVRDPTGTIARLVRRHAPDHTGASTYRPLSNTELTSGIREHLIMLTNAEPFTTF